MSDLITIRDEISHLAVPIDDVSPHPRNARQGDVTEIAASLQAHGQYRPVVAQRSTGHLLMGNHTWQAAKQLGWTHIAALHLDVDDDKALRILLVDNRTSDLARYDREQLAAVLDELAATDLALLGTGWDNGALDDLLRTLQPDDLDDLADQHGEPSSDIGWPVVKIRVPPPVMKAWKDHMDGYDDDSSAFAALLDITTAT